MAKPMFSCAGVHDGASDAETDLEVIKRLDDARRSARTTRRSPSSEPAAAST